MRKLLYSFVAAAAVALPAYAVSTSLWSHTTEADFKAGTFDNVVATNLGDLKLSRAVKTVLDGGNAFAQQRMAQNAAAHTLTPTECCRSTIGLPGLDPSASGQQCLVRTWHGSRAAVRTCKYIARRILLCTICIGANSWRKFRSNPTASESCSACCPLRSFSGT